MKWAVNVDIPPCFETSILERPVPLPQPFLLLLLSPPLNPPRPTPPSDLPCLPSRVAEGRSASGREESLHKIQLEVLYALFAVRQLLERFASCLRYQKRGSDTAQHKESENLHDVIEPGCSRALADVSSLGHGREDDLCNDGADLSGSSREAVRRRAEAGWETLGGNYEGGCVRT